MAAKRRHFTSSHRHPSVYVKCLRSGNVSNADEIDDLKRRHFSVDTWTPYRRVEVSTPERPTLREAAMTMKSHDGNDTSWNRCDVCGRFIALGAFVAGKAEPRLIYPASELTCETWETLCEAHRENRPRMTERDCIYPDCLIPTDFGKDCEHSCPYEAEKHEPRKAPEEAAPMTRKLVR